MPNVKNPNGPSKNRLAARATKLKAQRRKRSEHAQNKISKADTTRGARPGLLPTSGPRAAISKKKAKKLERQLRLAEKRKMEAQGVQGMAGVDDAEDEEENPQQTTKDVDMDVIA